MGSRKAQRRAGPDRFHARQYARKKTLLVSTDCCECPQLLAAGRQQGADRMPVEPFGGGLRTGNAHSALLSGTRTEKAQIFGIPAGFTQIFADFLRVRMGCIHHQRPGCNDLRKRLRGQPSRMDGNPGKRLHHGLSVLRSNIGLGLRPPCGKETAQGVPFARTRKNKHFHTPRYPRGVTIQPSTTRVAELPINTVVSISQGCSANAPSVVRRCDSPSRPMQRTSPQTVSGGSDSNRISQARGNASVRFRLAGL